MTNPISGERNDCLVECDERSGRLCTRCCRRQARRTPEYSGNLRGHAAVCRPWPARLGAAALHLIVCRERHASPVLVNSYLASFGGCASTAGAERVLRKAISSAFSAAVSPSGLIDGERLGRSIPPLLQSSITSSSVATEPSCM